MKEQSMSYNINLKICFLAIGLILASGLNQKALALSAADANADKANIVPLIPDEIALKETSDADALLTPPSLAAAKAKNTDVIPLDNQANDGEIQDLKLPNLNPSTNAPKPTNNAKNDVLKPLADNKPGANGGKPAPQLGLPAQKQDANNAKAIDTSFQQMQLLKKNALTPESSNFGEAILSQADNDLFNQMSDLEKQTSLLTLELRREKVKNEIAAIKAARQKSIDDANAKKEEKERKRIEWETEQKQKLLIEEQKLKELNIAYEKLRQERIVKAYKEEMLSQNQNWINNNEKLYDEIMKMEEDRNQLVNNLKLKLNYIAQLSAKASEAAEIAKNNYSRELANLQTQISILKSRLNAEKQAREQINTNPKDKTNPFASLSEKDEENVQKSQKLSDEYAIMEIRGQGSELNAKLINKNGSSFMVQKGTVLQTGHTVNEISQTFIKASKNGKNEYLYFAAGGVLDREPIKTNVVQQLSGVTPLPKRSDSQEALPVLSASDGLPSLRTGMFVR